MHISHTNTHAQINLPPLLQISSPSYSYSYLHPLTAFDSVVMAVSEAGGLNAIEELQNHPNQNIYQRAVKMLEVRPCVCVQWLHTNHCSSIEYCKWSGFSYLKRITSFQWLLIYFLFTILYWFYALLSPTAYDEYMIAIYSIPSSSLNAFSFRHSSFPSSTLYSLYPIILLITTLFSFIAILTINMSSYYHVFFPSIYFY